MAKMKHIDPLTGEMSFVDVDPKKKVARGNPLKGGDISELKYGSSTPKPLFDHDEPVPKTPKVVKPYQSKTTSAVIAKTVGSSSNGEAWSAACEKHGFVPPIKISDADKGKLASIVEGIGLDGMDRVIEKWSAFRNHVKVEANWKDTPENPAIGWLLYNINHAATFIAKYKPAKAATAPAHTNTPEGGKKKPSGGGILKMPKQYGKPVQSLAEDSE